MEATAKQPGKILRTDGDFAAAFASADKKVEAEYYIPHNAHAMMEPPAATCRIVDGKAEVWTSVQSPQAAHDLVAKYLGLPGENVTVNVTLLPVRAIYKWAIEDQDWGITFNPAA